MDGFPKSVFYSLKHYLKMIRWQLRRMRTAFKYGQEALQNAPIIFGNAMPKSGSHLLTQILIGLTSFGPFVNPGFPPVNRSEGNQPLPSKKIIRNIIQMKSGDIRYGYIHSKEPYLSILVNSNRATIFLYRDPRDLLVSHVFYATDMYKGHGMYPYYTKDLGTMETRLNAAIQGVIKPGFELPSVKKRYDDFWGWLKRPEVHCIKFEDLILDRDRALGSILDYLEVRGFSPREPREESVGLLKSFIVPQKSGTFRKGLPGNWREHFTESNKLLFKQVTGDLLLQLGYEENHEW